MSIEGCAVLLIWGVYTIWCTLSRRDWKGKALEYKKQLGAPLGRLMVRGKGED